MALTQYTADTDIIETLGTNPEDRPTLTDNTFKGKFDENAANIKAFLNAMIAELASTANGKGASQIGIEDSGSKFTAATVEAALAESATLISTLSGSLTTHTGEVVSRQYSVTRDLSLTGVQTVSITGTPKRIEIRAAINNASALQSSIGSWDAGSSSQSSTSVYKTAASAIVSGFSNVGAVQGLVNESNYNTGVIQNVVNGQFEINWTKIGSPTGTTTMQITCFYH